MSHQTNAANPARPPYRLTGALAPGAAVDGVTPAVEVTTVAGARRVRVRLQATVAGTLSVFPRRPAGGSRVTTVLPAGVAVSANTEAALDLELWGEWEIEVEFAAAGAGLITHADIYQIGV